MRAQWFPQTPSQSRLIDCAHMNVTIEYNWLVECEWPFMGGGGTLKPEGSAPSGRPTALVVTICIYPKIYKFYNKIHYYCKKVIMKWTTTIVRPTNLHLAKSSIGIAMVVACKDCSHLFFFFSRQDTTDNHTNKQTNKQNINFCIFQNIN